MAKSALFIDAGFLLAGAHDLLGGGTHRSAFVCDYEELLPKIAAFASSHAAGAGAGPLLRTYWYDGARDGIPTAEHRRIGDLSYVKLRLGRLNVRNQQKGVDFLIYRDLTTLARTGAISRAYLFAGDEDLRESVFDAQDLGVQVVLLTFDQTKRTGVSAALLREADEVVRLSDPAYWSAHFAPPPEPAERRSPPARDDLLEAARAFAATWAEGVTPNERAALLAGAPSVPRHLYLELVVAAEATVGSLRERGEDKGRLRDAFLETVRAMDVQPGDVADGEG